MREKESKQQNTQAGKQAVSNVAKTATQPASLGVNTASLAPSKRIQTLYLTTLLVYEFHALAS